jgi:glyoxylase-like metal-dependent hydrolase (beta-lactamase superfamily II)
MEVAPGIHRIESDLGPRFMCQYFFAGAERRLLFDAGLAATPGEVIVPYLEGAGYSFDAIDYFVTSHADVDHCGGNRLCKELAPDGVLMCHERDRAWVESNAAMMAENYGWHEAYGFPQFDADKRADMTRDLGGDQPVDVGLRGGEVLRLEPGWNLEIMHLPGHTFGQIGIWDPRSRSAIIIDAVLDDGIYDRAGNRLIPPRYYTATGYRKSIQRIRSLQPELLLTAHYPVMDSDEAGAWLDHALAFTDSLEGVVRAGVDEGITDLWELTQRADQKVGPYPDFMTELGASVRAHAYSL